MTTPTKLNFKIYQGSTFKETLRYESSDIQYAPITGITKEAPMVVTSTSHGIPKGWRVKITNVLGMKEVNSSDTYLVVSDTATNTLTFNSINSLAYTNYASGGVLEYNAPVNLSTYTARMQIRSASGTLLDELTTENGKIIIDNGLKTITLNIAATDTANYTFSSAVYSIELVSGIEVIPFIYGNMTLEKEITR